VGERRPQEEAMGWTFHIGKCTLLGNYRENNEDAVDVKVFPELTVCIVADGMGGQAAGEIASRKAVEIIPRELRKSITPQMPVEAVKQAARRAIVLANEEIMALGASERDMRNMGTTVVLAFWRNRGQELFITGVGDSRAYLIRPGFIQQLTVDHSLAQALVEARTISAAEAKEHRFRNVLWKYLGSKEVGEGPEVQVLPLQAGDRYLLCTDGLTGVVSDEQLAREVNVCDDMQQCAEHLCQLALDQGSRDNVSCVVIEVAQEDT
jgi:protein phosphatase